jgi:hypothetical protein
MIWIRDPQQLSYNTMPDGIDCWCQPILESADVNLQGIMDYNGTLTSYNALVLIYSPDGLTNYGSITSSFTFNYAKNPNGEHFFIATLNSIPSAMCSHPCFVLRVQITTGSILYFDYFTEQYCLKAECCDIPSGITIFQTSIQGPKPNLKYGGTLPTNTSVTGSRPQADLCAKPYLKLETYSECFNNISGKYYKEVNGKRYINVFNIEGRLKALPYDIQRDMSLNCRLQRTQVQKLYELEGFVLFSFAAMEAINMALTDQFIFIEGERYEMATGVAFEAVQIPNQCQLVYKLRVQLQSCIQKQIFGCGDGCSSNAQAFLIPQGMQAGNGYFGENKQFIGTTVDELKDYFITYPDAGEVTITDLDPEDYTCEFFAGFTVEADGYIPTNI